MKQLFTMFALGWLCLGAANAQNVGDTFSADNINYRITNTTTNEVAVTGANSSGDITIPQEVTHEDITYAVTEIGERAFMAKNATSITIPEGVTTIGEFAFYDCKVATINFPNTITAIEMYAFEYCTWYNNLPDGVIYIGKVLYKYKGTMPENTSIEVKDGIKAIQSSAFEWQSNLTSLTLPEGVTTIGSSAFYGCSNLSTIEFPASLTNIGQNAFNGTAWYNNLSDGVVYTGSVLYCHKGTMPENTTIEVKEGTIIINDYAFSGQNNLVSITLPTGITSIGQNAFSGCRNLPSIELPSSVTTIKDQAFENCESLKSIEIPQGVTAIGGIAFSGCSKLASVTIKGAPTIGYVAFYNCALERLICTSETAPAINEYTFYEMTVEKIGVPRSSIAAYKTAENWSTFSDKIAAICTVNVASGNEEHGTAAADITLAIENETVTLTATAAEGYAFAQWSDGDTDNPREIVVTDDISLTAQFEAKPSTAIERTAIESLRAEAGRVICNEAFRIYSLSGADVTSQNGTLKGLYIVKTATAAQKVTL